MDAAKLETFDWGTGEDDVVWYDGRCACFPRNCCNLALVAILSETKG